MYDFVKHANINQYIVEISALFYLVWYRHKGDSNFSTVGVHILHLKKVHKIQRLGKVPSYCIMHHIKTCPLNSTGCSTSKSALISILHANLFLFTYYMYPLTQSHTSHWPWCASIRDTSESIGEPREFTTAVQQLCSSKLNLIRRWAHL